MISYINQTVKDLNDCVDEIYEGLMDKESEEVLSAIKKLDKITREIKETLKEEL
jgi:hypothetical protein